VHLCVYAWMGVWYQVCFDPVSTSFVHNFSCCMIVCCLFARVDCIYVCVYLSIMCGVDVLMCVNTDAFTADVDSSGGAYTDSVSVRSMCL